MAFSPTIRSYRPRSDRPGQFRQVMEQLFPGYLFVFFDPEIDHTSEIELCPGISQLVRFAGEITPIRDSVVDEIMQLPVCTQAFTTKHPGKHSWRNNTKPLNNQQRRQIQSLVEENNGLTRSAMFYAFAESLR
ncbi:transcriptional activator RfaH [Xenorhabdus mauleonii]|uniref:Transcriptional activator RfaH n=2 Tax=Xenorhabdus mauleonii TaxID=351675 RepID=A0A1I3V602_9GAMM|nr:transcriptional activator RfaH [Xenorhabdus mauleonii]SFJ89617.1 transcriptional antiterminator RfaH [Xenorhabdus mauleonii]